MWVFTLLGYFSIVAHRDRPGYVLVRARVRTDLAAFLKLLPLPHFRLQMTSDADYRFRLVARKQHVASLLATLTEDIDYDNFKDAVAERQGLPRAKIYHDVWHALLPLQSELALAKPKLTLVRSKPKPKRGVSFGMVSGAELDRIERAKAERVAEIRERLRDEHLLETFPDELTPAPERKL